MSGLYNGPAVVQKITVTPQAEKINLGFKPGYVSIYNETNGVTVEWFSTMASGESKKTIIDGTVSKLSSGAITINDGTDGLAKGITIPNNLVDINDAAAEVLHVMIFREAKV